MCVPDYHTHTNRCGHAVGTAAEYVDAARAANLPGIGIADHLPLLPEPDPVLAMPLEELGSYVAEVMSLKAAYPGYVFLGIEADYRPETVEEVRGLLESHPFDYVIGSVHHLGDWGFDDPRQLAQYEGRDLDQVWRAYLGLVGDAAESGLFTVLGHLDLLKKFGHHPGRDLDEEWDRLVTRIARAGVVVEINTAGLYRPAGETYPSLDLLRRLRAAGVPVTFGSDAHRPTEVGRDFAFALELACHAGYRDFALLEARRDGARAAFRRQPLPLPCEPSSWPGSSAGETAKAELTGESGSLTDAADAAVSSQSDPSR